jgi:hypothetical protein
MVLKTVQNVLCKCSYEDGDSRTRWRHDNYVRDCWVCEWYDITSSSNFIFCIMAELFGMHTAYVNSHPSTNCLRKFSFIFFS